jgi:hypothetical protein
MKKFLIFSCLFLFSLTAVSCFLPPKNKEFDARTKPLYEQLVAKFYAQKNLTLVAYWAENDYRINDDFIKIEDGKYSINNSLFIYSQADVIKKLQEKNLDYNSLIELFHLMEGLQVQLIDDWGDYLEIFSGGLLDNYGGLIYSATDSAPPENEHDYYFIKEIDTHWYEFSHT